MRMKDKIRRAYDHAAPDGLGRILQEIPQKQTAPAPRSIPTRKKTSHLREFVATAAAFALLISVIGGTVWYAGQLTPGTGATNPTEPITSPSTDPDATYSRPEIYAEDLDYLAEDILYPWHLRDVVYDEPEEKTLIWHVCSDDVYVLKKIMGDYVYEFHFDTFNGKLLAVLVVDTTNNFEKGFIPDTVARTIARLNAGISLEDPAYTDHCQLVKTGSSGYYCITISGIQKPSTAVYYIHAQTGVLLELGAEVESGYTVGPQPSVDTTPPDGLIPEDMAILFAASYANVEEYFDLTVSFDPSTPAYTVTFNDSKYLYEVTLHAYSGEILAFPTPVLMDDLITPPDGNIGPELAGQTALDYLGFLMEKISNFSCTFVDSSTESDHYLITFDDETTHFIIKVGAYNPSVLSCEKFQLEGATVIMARNYALDYVGISMENVHYLQIGNTSEGGFLIHMVSEGVEYQFTLDYYGSVIRLAKNDAPPGVDETRTDIIGWRAARDIYMADKGMTLDEVTEFSYQFIDKEGYEEHYEVFINGSLAAIVAKSGEYFYEGDGDGPVIYTKAILTVDEITQIVMQNVDEKLREDYAAGAFGECYIDAQVRYEGGPHGLIYEWMLFADGTHLIYWVDAFTGEILSQYVIE